MKKQIDIFISTFGYKDKRPYGIYTLKQTF